MTEGKAIVTEGFRTEGFEGEVVDFTVKEISGYTKVIFEFTDGPALSIFPPKSIEGYKVPGYMDLGILINSLTTLGIDTFLDVDDSTLELEGIRTEPDICGMTLTFGVNQRKWINKEGEEKTNYEWRVLKAESNATPPPKQPDKVPDSKPTEQPAQEESTDDLIGTWTTIILDALASEPKSEGKLMAAMKEVVTDKAEQSKLNKVRRDAINGMITSGEIVQDGTNYKLS